jgi:hypothetical protein
LDCFSSELYFFNFFLFKYTRPNSGIESGPRPWTRPGARECACWGCGARAARKSPMKLHLASGPSLASCSSTPLSLVLRERAAVLNGEAQVRPEVQPVST